MKSFATSYRLTLLLAGVIVFSAGCESDHRMPAKIYIPEGYIGWVRIEYGVKGAPKQESHFFDHTEYQRFPPSGLLQTATTLKQGAASAEYFSYAGSTIKPLSENLIHGGTISWCAKKPNGARLDVEFVTFFVGPKEDYEQHKQELLKLKVGDCNYVVKSIEDLPKVGNVNARRIQHALGSDSP
jgi:hypothetical protein